MLSTPPVTPIEKLLPEIHRTDSSTRTRAKGAPKGFIMGIGIGLVPVIVLALITGQLERDFGPDTFVLFLFALSFFIPLILAVRGCYIARRKDTTP